MKFDRDATKVIAQYHARLLQARQLTLEANKRDPVKTTDPTLDALFLKMDMCQRALDESRVELSSYCQSRLEKKTV